MQATVLVKRTGYYASRPTVSNSNPNYYYYQQVFTANPEVQAICFDAQHGLYFGVTVLPNQEVIVGTICNRCEQNRIVVGITQPGHLIVVGVFGL